jgi:diaminohydroxyphosphoribosylaminopyrimidine deaminase/5-amino-6-(5-phosphoribosylamino)uracil reductase
MADMMTADIAADRHFMQSALALAVRGLGNVWPNPSVGCVIVKDGIVVGRGWTQPGGRPHAETEALARAGEAARGATAYVNLEPCSHHGETAPCADALVEAGVARVVVAIGDPDERVSGQGIERLRAAGIAVETGVMAEAATALNRGFLTRVTAGRPMVTLKLAASLDGRIATHNGDSQWITAEDARAMGHGLRAMHDAVAVGNGTAAMDDPHLTCRLPGLPVRPPVRIVFDSRLQLPMTRQLIATARTVPTWIVTLAETVEESAVERADALQDLGVGLIPVPPDANGRISIAAALQALGDAGLTRLMVEGGGKLAASFLSEGLVDALALFRGPSIIGGDGIPAIAGLGLERVADAAQFRLTDSRCLGVDMFESYVRIAA